jgi:hypothetical protein
VPSGVTVDNTGSSASYEVRLPTRAHVLILVGTDTVFVSGPDKATPRVIDLASP